MPAREQNVLWLDVAVHDTVALGVGQGFGHLARDLEGIMNRQLLLPAQTISQ
jgi:hypothetical protein